jgi:hypothetical protein
MLLYGIVKKFTPHGWLSLFLYCKKTTSILQYTCGILDRPIQGRAAVKMQTNAFSSVWGLAASGVMQ